MKYFINMFIIFTLFCNMAYSDRVNQNDINQIIDLVIQNINNNKSKIKAIAGTSKHTLNRYEYKQSSLPPLEPLPIEISYEKPLKVEKVVNNEFVISNELDSKVVYKDTLLNRNTISSGEEILYSVDVETYKNINLITKDFKSTAAVDDSRLLTLFHQVGEEASEDSSNSNIAVSIDEPRNINYSIASDFPTPMEFYKYGSTNIDEYLSNKLEYINQSYMYEDGKFITKNGNSGSEFIIDWIDDNDSSKLIIVNNIANVFSPGDTLQITTIFDGNKGFNLTYNKEELLPNHVTILETIRDYTFDGNISAYIPKSVTRISREREKPYRIKSESSVQYDNLIINKSYDSNFFSLNNSFRLQSGDLVIDNRDNGKRSIVD